jgi:hypothetical protein
MEIYQTLKKEHDHVKNLFEQAKKKKTPSKGGDNIFAEISHELEVHTQIEEKLFYSALKDDKSLHDEILQAYEEHNIVKHMLKDMSTVSPDDEKFMAKLNVLQELVEHHIEEEEGSIFKKAKKVLDKSEAEEMGMKFEEQKEEQQ